jgi:hypothetical protein
MNLNELIKEATDIKRREKDNGELPVIVKGITIKSGEVSSIWVNDNSIELII